jgi:hypothetical protein
VLPEGCAHDGNGGFALSDNAEREHVLCFCCIGPNEPLGTEYQKKPS